jgi:drug/metabolite transporter (DMT)-like permease
MILAAATLWGGTATVARLAFRDHHVPPLTLVEARLFIATVLLLPWMLVRDRPAFRVARQDWGYFLILGIFGLAAVQGSYYYSISRLGVGLSILLQYLAPALIVLWEMARGRPALPRTIVAIVAALAGTALLVGGFDPRTLGATPLDWAVGFASALTFAFHILYSKYGLSRYSPLTVLFYTFLIAGTLWAIVTPPWRVLAAGYPARVWLLFLIVGIGSTLLPFALFYGGLQRLRAEQAGLLATLEPVVAVVLAWVFLGEALRSFQWLGAVLVLASTLLVSIQAPRETAITTNRL